MKESNVKIFREYIDECHIIVEDVVGSYICYYEDGTKNYTSFSYFVDDLRKLEELLRDIKIELKVKKNDDKDYFELLKYLSAGVDTVFEKIEEKLSFCSFIGDEYPELPRRLIDVKLHIETHKVYFDKLLKEPNSNLSVNTPIDKFREDFVLLFKTQYQNKFAVDFLEKYSNHLAGIPLGIMYYILVNKEVLFKDNLKGFYDNWDKVTHIDIKSRVIMNNSRNKMRNQENDVHKVGNHWDLYREYNSEIDTLLE